MLFEQSGDSFIETTLHPINIGDADMTLFPRHKGYPINTADIGFDTTVKSWQIFLTLLCGISSNIFLAERTTEVRL